LGGYNICCEAIDTENIAFIHLFLSFRPFPYFLQHALRFSFRGFDGCFFYDPFFSAVWRKNTHFGFTPLFFLFINDQMLIAIVFGFHKRHPPGPMRPLRSPCPVPPLFLTSPPPQKRGFTSRPRRSSPRVLWEPKKLQEGGGYSPPPPVPQMGGRGEGSDHPPPLPPNSGDGQLRHFRQFFGISFPAALRTLLPPSLRSRKTLSSPFTAPSVRCAEARSAPPAPSRRAGLFMGENLPCAPVCLPAA